MDATQPPQRDMVQYYADLLDPQYYAFDPLTLLNFGAALAVLVTGILILHWERGSRVSRLFAGFAALFTLWACGRGLLRLLADPDLLLFASRRMYVLIMLAVPFLYQFVLILLRADLRRHIHIRVAWIVGGLIALMSFSTPWVIGDWERYSWGLEPVYGPVGYLSAAWVALLVLASSADAVAALRASTPGSRERRRVALFCAALALLYLAFVDFLPTMGFAVYPFAFVPVTAFALLTAFITLRFGLVEVNPQLAAREIAGLVRGALLIVDEDGVVQYANEEAQRQLSPRRELAGTSARALMGENLDPAFLHNLSRMQGREAEKELVYRPPGSGAAVDLALSVSAVHDQRERDVAYVCLLRDITEQKRVQQQRLSEGLRDPLTGLPARAMFLEMLDGAVRRSQDKKDFDFAVCFIGIDRFQIINEDLGYSIGDQVLAEVGRRLRHVARAQDVVARLGGDEFGVLLDAADPLSVKTITQRLRDGLTAPMRLSDHDLHLSASIGIATSALAYTSGAEMLRDASVAMFRVKQKGGGEIHVVEQAERGIQRTRLESELHRAIERNEFRVYYQPVLDLGERRLAGFEALVRWQHPERGVVSPAGFIEFAEKIGLVRQIDHFVMQRACGDLARFQEAARGRPLTLSFNIGEGLMRDHRLPEELRNCLAANRLDPASVRIEVLERLAMIAPLRGTLNRLRDLGVGLYIDDFGTGYSSLSRLHDLPVTGVKIDREFVQAMSLGRGGEKIIVGIIALAETLQLSVIAEGASQAREARRLRDLHCRFVQGFFFSPAVPFVQALDLSRDPESAFADKHALLDAAWLTRLPDTSAAPVPPPAAAARPGVAARLVGWLRGK